MRAEAARAKVVSERPVQHVSVGLSSGKGQTADRRGVAISGVVGVLSRGISELKR